jgi:hypothetical protein
MTKQVITIGDHNHKYIGYISSKRWNGWVIPHFEIAEAMKVMQNFNSYNPEHPIIYDQANDTFIHNDDEIELWKGTDYNTEDGIKHLYDIGAYTLTWETIQPKRRQLKC